MGGVFLASFLPPLMRKGIAAVVPRVAMDSYADVSLIFSRLAPRLQRTQCAPTWRPKTLYIATPPILKVWSCDFGEWRIGGQSLRL